MSDNSGARAQLRLDGISVNGVGVNLMPEENIPLNIMQNPMPSSFPGAMRMKPQGFDLRQ